jgi:hypothetical protein
LWYGWLLYSCGASFRVYEGPLSGARNLKNRLVAANSR